MGRRFLFAREVEEIITKGQKEIILPEGSRISAAAADLIRQKGIRIRYRSDFPQTSESKPVKGGQPALPEAEERSNKKEKPSEEGEAQSEGENTGIRQPPIAVASHDRTVDSTIENVAAKSPYFLVFDNQGKLVETLENPYRETGSGAGALVADLMAEKGVRTFVAGNFGEKIRLSLDEKGISFFEFTGQVREAVSTVLTRNVSTD